MSVFVVAIGGAAGAVARYLTYLWLQKFYGAFFPLPTLLINILGCFLIGILMLLVENNAPNQRHLLLIGATGFLGSYTTFSTFGFETFHLIRSNQFGWVAVYVTTSVVLGLAAIWAGRALFSTLKF